MLQFIMLFFTSSFFGVIGFQKQLSVQNTYFVEMGAILK